MVADGFSYALTLRLKLNDSCPGTSIPTGHLISLQPLLTRFRHYLLEVCMVTSTFETTTLTRLQNLTVQYTQVKQLLHFLQLSFNPYIITEERIELLLQAHILYTKLSIFNWL